MGLNKKESNYLVILLMLFCVFLLLISSIRIAPYSIKHKIPISGINYTNEISLFDTSVVHEIKLELTDIQYQKMISEYKQNLESKDYQKTDIVIDGVKIKNVGIRFKGNSSLRAAIYDDVSLNPPPTPYLIKFDKYIPGQKYQGRSEIVLRNGVDITLLREFLALTLHKKFGQIVPDVSYGVINTTFNESNLYLIVEHINNDFIEKNFNDNSGVLYKVNNLASLRYRGPEPLEYIKEFEQKSTKGFEEMNYLLDFLYFINTSSDRRFEKELPIWLNIDSLINMMALDTLLANRDSFVGVGSNYYIYANKEKKKYEIISWDQNLALDELERKNWSQKRNLLRERILENKSFNNLYQKKYNEFQEIIFTKKVGIQTIHELSQPFIEYNKDNKIIELDRYIQQKEIIKQFFK